MFDMAKPSHLGPVSALSRYSNVDAQAGGQPGVLTEQEAIHSRERHV
jgi:hypothetical protein